MTSSLANPGLASAARIAELISQETDLHTADPNALALSLARYIRQGAFDKAHAAFSILACTRFTSRRISSYPGGSFFLRVGPNLGQRAGRKISAMRFLSV
jgi:hypothetical protein